MVDLTSEAEAENRPYKHSLVDRFTQLVERWPRRPWVFYLLFGLGLIAIQLFFLWLDGGIKAVELMPVIIFNGLATPFLLALIHLLDDQAVTALKSMRTMIEMTEGELEYIKFKLANMPFPVPLVVGLGMMAFYILTPYLTAVPVRFAALEGLPVFAVPFYIIDNASAFLSGVLIYHTIRQLRLVNQITSDSIRINLLQIGPLQAFSRLTASTAVGLLLFMNLWLLINPDLLANPVSLGLAAGFGIITVSVFVWPLYGFHRLIEAEKSKALQEIDRRLEEVFVKFDQHFLEDDYPALDVLNGTISSLEIQRNRVEAVPTWPWKSGTVRSVMAAIALPLILMLVQILVEQAFN
jgi:hypothetical protein